MVAVFIVTLLLLLFVTVVHQQRLTSRRIVCESRQMQLTRALLYYEMSTGSFPGYRDVQTVDHHGQPKPTSWVFFTLPFINDADVADEKRENHFQYEIEKQRLKKNGLNTVTGPYADLFRQYGPEAVAPWRGQTPSQYIPQLVCPNNQRPDNTGEATVCWMSFVVNTGMPDAVPTVGIPRDWPANGVFTDQFPGLDVLPQRISYAGLLAGDGAGVTLMLTENVDSGLWTDVNESQVGFCWTPDSVDGKPVREESVLKINREIGQGDGTIRFARPSSYHEGGVNVSYCDGSTGFLSQDIDAWVYSRLMTSDSANVRYAGTDIPVDVPFGTGPATSDP